MTDEALNLGNRGRPLLNRKGEFVGLVAADGEVIVTVPES